MIKVNNFQEQHAKRLVQSFKFVTGRDLLEPFQSMAQEGLSLGERLFESPFVVVSHSGGSDPKLNYGNQVALDLWQMTWDSFVGTPSRLTAESEFREGRAAMLEQARIKGFIDDYEGIRVSSTGRRFMIKNAVIWAVPAIGSEPDGQAATFSNWNFLE
ncbi:MEKHLA domain-containing protein [Kiloniella antarctica]|uniref:MEKHLA domain-containing protein n=1 Tax=Kiloniella antarctica TaxID=1550907 RepID=A0ABW5BKM5_9PROT